MHTQGCCTNYSRVNKHPSKSNVYWTGWGPYLQEGKSLQNCPVPVWYLLLHDSVQYGHTQAHQYQWLLWYEAIRPQVLVQRRRMIALQACKQESACIGRAMLAQQNPSSSDAFSQMPLVHRSVVQ